MQILIDREKCCGHAQCEDAAPDVFRVGDDALAHLLVSAPAEQFRPQVEDAVRRCPAGAIQIA